MRGVTGAPSLPHWGRLDSCPDGALWPIDLARRSVRRGARPALTAGDIRTIRPLDLISGGIDADTENLVVRRLERPLLRADRPALLPRGLALGRGLLRRRRGYGGFVGEDSAALEAAHAKGGAGRWRRRGARKL